MEWSDSVCCHRNACCQGSSMCVKEEIQCMDIHTVYVGGVGCAQAVRANISKKIKDRI